MKKKIYKFFRIVIAISLIIGALINIPFSKAETDEKLTGRNSYVSVARLRI